MTPEDAVNLRGGKRGWRAQRDAEMVQAAEDGETYSEIAERVGLSLPRTSQILRANGAPVPKHGKGVRLRIDYAPYRKKYEAGATVRELAVAADVSYGAMYRGLKAAGTPFRPRGGPGIR